MKTDLNPCTAFYSGDQYNVSTSIGYSLRGLAWMMRNEIESRMTRHGVTAAQWHPLFLLKLGKATTALELARELGIDAGATTRMVDRLVAKGLVERVRSDSDRRVVHLGLSKTGIEVASVIPHVLASVQNDYLKGFTAEDLDRLQGLVSRMLDNGDAMRAVRPARESASRADAEADVDVDDGDAGAASRSA